MPCWVRGDWGISASISPTPIRAGAPPPAGQFVTFAVGLLGRGGWTVVNADLTLIAQLPRIAQSRELISSNVAGLLGVEAGCVNIKANHHRETRLRGTFGRPGCAGRGVDCQGRIDRLR